MSKCPLILHNNVLIASYTTPGMNATDSQCLSQLTLSWQIKESSYCLMFFFFLSFSWDWSIIVVILHASFHWFVCLSRQWLPMTPCSDGPTKRQIVPTASVLWAGLSGALSFYSMEWFMAAFVPGFPEHGPHFLHNLIKMLTDQKRTAVEENAPLHKRNIHLFLCGLSFIFFLFPLLCHFPVSQNGITIKSLEQDQTV